MGLDRFYKLGAPGQMLDNNQKLMAIQGYFFSVAKVGDEFSP